MAIIQVNESSDKRAAVPFQPSTRQQQQPNTPAAQRLQTQTSGQKPSVVLVDAPSRWSMRKLSDMWSSLNLGPSKDSRTENGISRIYSNAAFSISDSSLKSWTPRCLNANDFSLYELLGTGTFSNVYRGVNNSTQEEVAVKVIKPEKVCLKLKKEMYILEYLGGGPNIVGFHGSYSTTASSAIPDTMVMELANSCRWCELDESMDLMRMQRYLFDLLRALDYSHSRGVMHRDIKPQNILYDIASGKLMLADWGQAEFYEPNKKYSTRGVSSLYFKAPELFLDYETYDSSIDMWAVGCILASFMFRVPFVFKGAAKDYPSQFQAIVKIMGGSDLQEYCKRYSIPLYKAQSLLPGSLSAYTKMDWESLVNDSNCSRVTDEGLDLLESLLRYDHQERLTAKEAMAHPFFKEMLRAM
ncbi:casein kinase II [Polychytrium aggregatum]|uniref:casein kinase II n=1 Tax=Polychytrium aggregatum TaxID=110093 RepID=UPI0022FE0826|nr:casein kinase II [Polychytrium aggregatum]KAI9202324.1 casein kinase II [Polychytrium aggregatum]